MGLTPDDIERREFTSTLRGFDRIEVREFLHRVAERVRDLEEERDASLRRAGTADVEDQRAEHELELARRAADGVRAAAAEEAARILRESEAYGQQARVEADRLRADADRIRRQSIQLAEQRRAQIDALVERRRQELDELVERRRREVAELVRSEHARVESAGRAVEAARREIDAERERAHAEVEEARRQVAQLLEQARAQSEFIRAEADELVRVKVRTTTAQAEERLAILRTTEQASRERIRAAQRELDAALQRLDAEPTPALAPGTDEVVLGEVRTRALAAAPAAHEAAPPMGPSSSGVPRDAFGTAVLEAVAGEGHDDASAMAVGADIAPTGEPIPTWARTDVDPDEAAPTARQGRVPSLHLSIPAALMGGAPPDVGLWPSANAGVDAAPAPTPPSAPLPTRNRCERPPIPAPDPARAGFPSGPVRRSAVPPVPPPPTAAGATPTGAAPTAPSGAEAALARMVKEAMHHAFDGTDRPSGDR